MELTVPDPKYPSVRIDVGQREPNDLTAA